MPTPLDGTTTLRGLGFHFLDWGTAGRPPLLLLHGGAQTAHSWDEVAPDLARDHDVRALLDDRRLPAATIMALSLGGLNAIAFAAAHPDRVRALVVVDVTPTINPAGSKAIAAQLAHRE